MICKKSSCGIPNAFMSPFWIALDTLPRQASSYCPSRTWILARAYVVVVTELNRPAQSGVCLPRDKRVGVKGDPVSPSNFICASANSNLGRAMKWLGISMRKSPDGNVGVRPGDVQVVAGIAEHDPRRGFARGARDRDRGRLPRRQHRFEPRDRRLVGQPLLGRYHHVAAVGRRRVVDQGGGVRVELLTWPVMAAISAARAAVTPATA